MRADVDHGAKQVRSVGKSGQGRRVNLVPRAAQQPRHVAPAPAAMPRAMDEHIGAHTSRPYFEGRASEAALTPSRTDIDGSASSGENNLCRSPPISGTRPTNAHHRDPVSAFSLMLRRAAGPAYAAEIVVRRSCPSPPRTRIGSC